MRLGCRVAMTLVLAALVAGLAAAQQQRGQRGQGRGGFGGGMFGGGMFDAPDALLMNESVQKELKLSEDQVSKIKQVNTQLFEKHKDDFSKLQDLSQEERGEKRREIGKTMSTERKKELAGVLKPEQEKRLKEIWIQQRGLQAFQEVDVQKELSLTDEQKETIKVIGEDSRKDMQELMQGAGGGRGRGFSPELQKKMAAVRKEAMDKAVATLKDDQKTKWKEMTGKPFEVVYAGFGGGGGGGRRGNRGQDKDKDK